MSSPLVLDWSMTRQGNVLTVHYQVENPTSDLYYVCDKLLKGAGSGAYSRLETLSVGNTSSPGTIVFTLGTPPTRRPAYRLLPVTYVPLDPGRTLKGSRDLELPLKAFNPQGGEQPLSDKAEKAVLLVFAFKGEPPRWKELPGDDGAPIRVPMGQPMSSISGTARPLPK